jgi:uncharacterized protein
MPSLTSSACDNYFGKVFAHLSAALAVAAASAEYSDLGANWLGRQTPLVSILVNIGVAIALIIAIYKTTPGSPLKYVAFGAFAYWLGQTLKPYTERLKDKKTLTRALMMTSGVFLGMMALGFYDKQNLLGFGPFLFAGLIGLIFAQLLVVALATPAERATAFEVLRFIGIALFAVFTAYDVQKLKESAKFCKKLLRKGMAPDYPAESLGLFLDFINLFVRMGGGDE